MASISDLALVKNSAISLDALSPKQRRNASLVLVAILALYGISYMRDPSGGHLIDGINLAIHETGHLIFAPFGDFLAALGGTLFQLIVPGVFCFYFARRGERLGAAVCLWWVAVNCWNIAVYVADSRTLELELVGGGEHDWNFLLSEVGLLRSDQGIARVWNATGFILYVIALALGVRAALAPHVAQSDRDALAETPR